MTYKELCGIIKTRQSFLCLGLDPDINKIPISVKSGKNPLFSFCKEIVDEVADTCVAFKINTAFFEAEGSKGFAQLEELCHYLHGHYPNHLLIADAKRADIGNTSSMYAKAFFNTLACDAITLHPYMGRDSIEPFLQHHGKWSILLSLTSNSGAADFEQMLTRDGIPLYLEVMQKANNWGSAENMMFVIGATKSAYVAEIRKRFPDHFFLVPGTGTQGGDMGAVIAAGSNAAGGLLINVSRDILYASSGSDFTAAAASKAKYYLLQMRSFFKFDEIKNTP
ncbi:MAG: orotidine-5'-phosphate decarboxylase [Bacteroidota bacterium]|jgi:orotidine-5'-phosphate decarboxylase